MALNKKIELEINKQINEETFSAYLYLSMAAHFESLNLSGFASWMKVQAQEEMVHAMKFFDYLVERQGIVVLDKIEKPQTSWKSPLEMFEAAYTHEEHITGRINLLVKIAREENDYATENMLQWFVAEQVEEESTADGVVQQLKMIKGSSEGLYMLDKELGTRVFVPPPTNGAGA